MASLPSFAASAWLPSRAQPLRTSRRTPFVCTLAPERSRTREKSFRTLPDNLPSSAEQPPCPPRHKSIPYVGFFLEEFLKMDPITKSTYGPIYTSNYFLQELVHISDYNTIVEISRSSDVFTAKGAMPAMETIFPGNMLSKDGRDHLEMRAAYTPAFAKALFPCYYPFVQRRTGELWEKVLQELPPRGRMKLEPYIRKHYVSVIIELSSGIDMKGALADRIQSLFSKVQEGLVTSYLGPLSKPAIAARDEMMGILRGIVLENIKKHGDIIDNLRLHGDNFAKHQTQQMKQGKVNLLLVLISMTSISTAPGATHDTEIIDKLANAMTGVWLAGFMTISVSTMSSVFELGMNPQVYERLLADQIRIVEENSGKSEVTYEQVMGGMPLLDSFINEVLRLHPAAALTLRKVNQDVEILGYLVKKGSTVNLNFAAAQRDPEVYENPNELVLDRFAREEKAPSILTFGAPGAAHFCLGYALAKMLLNNVLATLLRNYTIELDRSQRKDFQCVPDGKPRSGVVVTGFSQRMNS